jgi:hypothetical protein
VGEFGFVDGASAFFGGDPLVGKGFGVEDGGDDLSARARPSRRGCGRRRFRMTGFSKSYAMTGWRIGYAVGRADAVTAMTRIHQALLTSVTTGLAACPLGTMLRRLLSEEEPAVSRLRLGDLTGRLYESLMALSVQTYAQAARCRVSHLRTQSGEPGSA